MKINLQEMKFRKVSGKEKYIGLMFKTRKTIPLLFEFKEDVNLSIHSYFVFFPFRIIWLDKDDNVIEEKIVKPFTLSVRPSKSFRKILEIPI